MSLQPSPNISVIMSVFNGERYIARALMSILSQTYADFELILIDDGSTDSTAQIVSQVKDIRLKFHRQENRGLTKTLNKALSLAKGRWIARHDADDFSICTRFMEQVDFLDKNPSVGLLGTSCFIQPEKHGIINEVYDYPELHEEILRAFPVYNPFVHGSVMVRRDLLEAHGGYNESYRYVQDYELWSRILPTTQSHNLSSPLYVRSIHSEASQMSVDKEPIFNEIKSAYLKKSDCIPQVNPTNGSMRTINSKSLYPLLTLTGNWNLSVAKTFYRIGQECRRHNLAWARFFGQAFLYSPWFFLSDTHA
jgi:glycosyltransferase involved in cell wall biosynthesis